MVRGLDHVKEVCERADHPSVSCDGVRAAPCELEGQKAQSTIHTWSTETRIKHSNAHQQRVQAFL